MEEMKIKMGKTRQVKNGPSRLDLNPRSKHYDKDLAKRRAKEKARRKAAAKNRA